MHHATYLNHDGSRTITRITAIPCRGYYTRRLMKYIIKGVGQESSLSYLSTGRCQLTTLWESLESSSRRMALTWRLYPTRTGYDAATCGEGNIGTSGCGIAKASLHAKPDAYSARHSRPRQHESAAAMLSPTSTGRSTSGHGVLKSIAARHARRVLGTALMTVTTRERCRNAKPDEYWAKHLRLWRYKSIAVCRARRVQGTAPPTAAA